MVRWRNGRARLRCIGKGGEGNTEYRTPNTEFRSGALRLAKKAQKPEVALPYFGVSQRVEPTGLDAQGRTLSERRGNVDACKQIIKFKRFQYGYCGLI